MNAGVTIEGQDRLAEQLRRKLQQYAGKPVVNVGFSAPYAVIVHEDTQAVHPNGEAKFLENAIRQDGPAIRQQLAADLRAGKTLAEAELHAGEAILVGAQARCPVQTGFLVNSGYVEAGGGI